MNGNEEHTAGDFKHQARINHLDKWVLNVCFICGEPDRYFLFEDGKVFLKTECGCRGNNLNIKPIEQDWEHVKNVYYAITQYMDKVQARKFWGF